MHVLVVGLRATGAAVVDWLADHGDEVTVVEERPGQVDYDARRAAAVARGATVLEAAPDWDALVADADLVVPSPGVHPDHPVMRAAGALRVPVRGDLDLAVEAATVPVVAVTGTNGKSTVTSLVDRDARTLGGARTRRRQHRSGRARRAGRARRRPGRGGVVVPAAHGDPRVLARGRGAAQPGRRSPRLARLLRRVRGRQEPRVRLPTPGRRCSSPIATTPSWCRGA